MPAAGRSAMMVAMTPLPPDAAAGPMPPKLLDQPRAACRVLRDRMLRGALLSLEGTPLFS